jgi:hypothetical protein
VGFSRDGGGALRSRMFRRRRAILVARWRHHGFLAAPSWPYLGLSGLDPGVTVSSPAVGGVARVGDGRDGGTPTAVRRRELQEPAGLAGPRRPGLLVMLRAVGGRCSAAPRSQLSLVDPAGLATLPR